MHTSLRVLNARKPLIHFIGKRSWPSEAGSQSPHPAAPSELQKSFSDFVKKFEASSSLSSHSGEGKKGGSKAAFGEFWEAPARFWRPRIRELEDAEIDAISSGGASLH
jgi:small subunit ribosomal protein YMR-31